MSNCLTDFIGLSQYNCNCPDFANKPTDISLSGYYIDDEVSINQLAYGECGQGSIWDILQRAKAKAILNFEADMIASIAKLFKPKTVPYFDWIGTKTNGGIDTSTNRFIGARIDNKGSIGSKMIVKNLSIGATVGGGTVLKIWKGYSLYNSSVTNIELLNTQNITLLPSQYTDIALTTPLDVVLKNGEHYFFSYELPLGAYAFINKYPTCGSCTQTNTKWRDTVNFYGFSSASEDFKNTGLSDSAHGFSFETSLFCDISQWYCKMKSLGNNDGAFRVTAKALNFKASICAIDAILKANVINFTTLNNKETLYGIRNHLVKEYESRLEWLSLQFPQSDFTCMQCNNNFNIRKQAIVA